MSTYSKAEAELRLSAYHELYRTIKMVVPLCSLLCAATKMRHVDIIKLDEQMQARFGQAYRSGQESLAEFMARQYGPATVELVRLLI